MAAPRLHRLHLWAGSWMRIDMQILSPFLVNTSYKLWWRSAVGSSGRYKEVLRCEGVKGLPSLLTPGHSLVSCRLLRLSWPSHGQKFILCLLSFHELYPYILILADFVLFHLYILDLSKNVLEGHHLMSHYWTACGNRICFGVLAVPRSIPSIRVGMNIIIFLRDVPSHHHQPFTTPPHHKHPPCDAVSRDAEDTADKRDPRAVNKIYEIHFTQTSSICD